MPKTWESAIISKIACYPTSILWSCMVGFIVRFLDFIAVSRSDSPMPFIIGSWIARWSSFTVCSIAGGIRSE
jgi:hypothetical protein